jgi:hypothetical protein
MQGEQDELGVKGVARDLTDIISLRGDRSCKDTGPSQPVTPSNCSLLGLGGSSGTSDPAAWRAVSA